MKTKKRKLFNCKEIVVLLEEVGRSPKVVIKKYIVCPFCCLGKARKKEDKWYSEGSLVVEILKRLLIVTLPFLLKIILEHFDLSGFYPFT